MKEKCTYLLKNNKTLIGTILLMLTGPVFILLASSWTSPIFKGSYGCDASFFSLVGRAILEGKVMYRDYFDIKGPAFFFWEAFGQLIARDRLGVFILQCITALFAAYFLQRICKLYYLSYKKKLFVFFIYYFVYTTTLWGGNCVEEFILPMTLGCICYGLEFLHNKNTSLTIAVFFGITFGLCLFSKVTVCAPMAAPLFVVLYRFIKEKEYKKLLCCAMYFLGGVLMVAVPILFYYYSRNAIDDLFLCVFNIAFKRGTDYYEGFSAKWESYLLICYFTFALYFVKRRERGIEKLMLLWLSIFTFLALHLGTPFDYYFTTTLPLIAYTAVLFCADIQSAVHKSRTPYMMRRHIRKIVIASAALTVVLCSYYTKTTNKLLDNYKIAAQETEMPYYNGCKEVFELIPESEQDNVFCIESDMIVFEVNQKLPANKYPINMPYFCELYPPAEDEIVDTIENHTPKWLVSNKLDEIGRERIIEAVFRNYEIIYDGATNELWRRKK